VALHSQHLSLNTQHFLTLMNKPDPLKVAAAHEANARKQIAYNRRARYEFEILDTYEAGLVLVGTEVKSLRDGKLNFVDSFIRIENGEAWLFNLSIAPYVQGNRYNVDEKRKRKILLHRWQIAELQQQTELKGLTIVPLSLFFQRGFAKLEIGLARGKKLFDKRESIADRDRSREAQRQLKEG